MSQTKLHSIDDFLGLLKGVKPTGKDQWLALCCGHNDREPSLSIKLADGKILIKCFAGCEMMDILNPLGLDQKDLFLNGRELKTATKAIVATYDYTDEADKVLYQTVRYDPKDFKQRQPDGNGGWIWKLKGVRLVLYRLPDVILAVNDGGVVYKVAGEKDADNLREHGFTATTNPLGEANGKWKQEFSETLRGAHVVIIQDKDDTGRRHSQEVASSLYGKADSLKVLELPDSDGHQVKDASDWFAAGGTREELEALVERAPEWMPTKTATVRKSEATGQEVREASFFVADHCIYEQIYTAGESAFVEYDTNTDEVKTIACVMQGEVMIIPRQGEEIKLGAVKLPSGVTEYGDTISLLREIEAHIHRYLDISAAFLKFAAYYILLSWVYDRFSTLPYLRSLGDTGTGKSRFLNVCGELCYKPTLASGCITPAPIYRMLKRWNGTIILDEADLKNSDEYNEVITILNCGFERGRPVIRAMKDNPDKLQFLPTFGPKVFATRRRFKDAALEARCLTEIMQETTRDDIPATLNSTFYKEQEALRNKLLLFRLRNYSQINAEEAVALDLHGIEPRLKQISACFISLFAGRPDVLSDYSVFIGNHQRELIEQRAATTTGQVVEKLFSLIESVANVTNVTDVTGEKLIPISSQEVAEMVNMTPQAVGQILKTLGLRMKVARVEGKSKRCIIFNQVKLDVLKKRYIPSEDDDDVTFVTAVTTVTGLSEDNAELIAAKPRGNEHSPIPNDSSSHPITPCHCGCGDYWLTDWNEWLCSRCHPKPNKLVRHTAISA